MLRRLIGEDINLVTILDADLGRVKADPGQIEQVLMNLVVNARDAMPQGGKITIETAERRPGGSVLRGCIPDMRARATTCCWPSATPAAAWTRPALARIFEPFFTTKEQGKGTGLGLATVYGIVKQSGGDISPSTAQPGEGQHVSRCICRGAAGAPGAGSAAESAEPSGGTETILIVEDEVGVRLFSRGC